MVKGKQKPVLLSVDEIYNFTSGGYDIYRYYLGDTITSGIMNRPWSGKEKKLSWGIFYREGVWFWKDLATEESGTAIQFVTRYFHLSQGDAIQKIMWDFGLGGKEINKKPQIVTWQKPEIREEKIKIKFSTIPFEKRHHEFWNAAEVTEDHCKKYECYAVKDLIIGTRRIYIDPNERAFAYYCTLEDAVKIYFPDRESTERFRNNVSYHYLWNYENIADSCENLIVQKSMKDLIVTTMIEPCCISTQAEAVKIFNEDVVEKINKVTNKPWIWYGSDWDGVKKCKEITDTNKWKYINTPKDLLPEINDAYGYVKAFGLKKLEEFMRSKKVIK